MTAFSGPKAVDARKLIGDHGGVGPIEFRRLFEADFTSAIDFVDFTIIPPTSVIGYHSHDGNDELYLVVSGTPTICVEGEERRMGPGDVAVVRSGQSHGLRNDSTVDVAIFVVQVRYTTGTE